MLGKAFVVALIIVANEFVKYIFIIKLKLVNNGKI
jgi:hypothetical protein